MLTSTHRATVTTFETPLGLMSAAMNDSGALTHLGFFTGPYNPVENALFRTGASFREADAPFTELRHQLDEYWQGRRRTFDLPLAPRGSAFQQQVWALLRAIPVGETRTYGQLAAALNAPGSARAVGRANATNPIAVIVPCHRVIGASGVLTGYAFGLDRKEWLLDHERTMAHQAPATA